KGEEGRREKRVQGHDQEVVHRKDQDHGLVPDAMSQASRTRSRFIRPAVRRNAQPYSYVGERIIPPGLSDSMRATMFSSPAPYTAKVARIVSGCPGSTE